MKLHRSLSLAALLFLAVLSAGAILTGCATTGDAPGEAQDPQASPNVADRAEGRVETAAPQGSDQAAANATEAGGSRPAAGKAPASQEGTTARTDGAAQAGGKPEEGPASHFVASLARRLERLFPAAFKGVNWNRVAGVVGGVIVLALVWGLALWLARAPRRRRRAQRPARPRTITEHARVPVST